MADHLLAWAHTTCGCHPDADPAFFHCCDLHLHAEQLKTSCLLAYSHVTDQATKAHLKQVLERIGVWFDA